MEGSQKCDNPRLKCIAVEPHVGLVCHSQLEGAASLVHANEMLPAGGDLMEFPARRREVVAASPLVRRAMHRLVIDIRSLAQGAELALVPDCA